LQENQPRGLIIRNQHLKIGPLNQQSDGCPEEDGLKNEANETYEAE